MADWIEFHDSTLVAIALRVADVELLLDAYIHRWEELNDTWKGTGWRQRVRVVVRNVMAAPAAIGVPLDITDGRLELAATSRVPSVVRLPLQTWGPIRLWLQLTTGDVLEVRGDAVRIEGIAPASYVEELPADMRPEDCR